MSEADAYDASDRALWESFVQASVTPVEWTHEAHVRVAYLHLRQYPFETAMELVRIRIQKLNQIHGTPEALERGYHETMTRAFMQLIAAAMRQENFNNSLAFCRKHPRLLKKQVLLEYYSRDRIISYEAKSTFITPDLQPLPEIN